MKRNILSLIFKKYIILTYFIFGVLLNVHSQSHGFEYTYDDAGNRVIRMYIILKSNPVNTEINAEDTASITDRSINQEYTIHPNPTRSTIQIDIPGTEEIVKQITIYSIQGAQICSSQQSDSAITIDLSNQPNGVYILVCQMNNHRKEWKIIKE